ncbi:hypothetical protein COLO4_00638 [Corchorus olitorius]|uniref:Uncharacterized protein n=1 Tax=Corchorus olitorius TaxID=93759 RepID=A0A1R3L3J2_9ROSI|nr:hypothetical protein COLO4_00638 [Corchorus olitorius]
MWKGSTGTPSRHGPIAWRSWPDAIDPGRQERCRFPSTDLTLARHAAEQGRDRPLGGARVSGGLCRLGGLRRFRRHRRFVRAVEERIVGWAERRTHDRVIKHAGAVTLIALTGATDFAAGTLFIALAAFTVTRLFAGRIEIGQLLARQIALDQLFDIGQQALIARGEQRQCVARSAGTTRAANAVHVVFCVERQVEVDYARHLRDVETARCHVGGDQHIDGTLLERFERLHALGLRLVAVNGVGVDAFALQRTRQTRAADLAVGEHDALARQALLGTLLQQVHERRLLVVVRHGVDDLADILRRGVAAGHFNGLRMTQVAGGQLLDLRRERRREQQRLAVCRQQVDDALQVGQEAHVEHAIGFVEHQHAHLRQVHAALLHVVEQAARRGHEDLHAAAQLLCLRVHVDAAEHHGAAQRRVLRVLGNVVVHLVGEFARGREDQRPHRVARRRRARIGVGQQVMDDRQRETGGLAGAGLCGAHDVAAGGHHRNGGGLDGRGLGVTAFGQRAEDVRMQAEAVECHRFIGRRF